MKKLSVLAALVLILALCVPESTKAATEDDADRKSTINLNCSHSEYICLNNLILSDWIYNDGSTHIRTWVTEYVCLLCSTHWYSTPAFHSSEPHHWDIWLDGGHLPGNRHMRYRNCKDCGGSTSQTFSCNGNPCRMPE